MGDEVVDESIRRSRGLLRLVFARARDSSLEAFNGGLRLNMGSMSAAGGDCTGCMRGSPIKPYHFRENNESSPLVSGTIRLHAPIRLRTEPG